MRTTYRDLSFGDGYAEGYLEYGDRSTGPFIHLDLSNVDAPPHNRVRIALDIGEARDLAALLMHLAAVAEPDLAPGALDDHVEYMR